MVEVSYPGVYVVEVSSGVHTITGVSTSIGAFLGRTAKGPLNKAVRCTSFGDFDRTFGGTHSKADLPKSVRMFFENGGTDCYVVRLAKDAHFADVTLRASDGATSVLVAKAKSAGDQGNSLELEVSYGTPQPDETFNLSVIQKDGDQELARETHVSLSMDPDSPRFAPTFVSAGSDLVTLELGAPVKAGGAKDLADPAKSSTAGFSQSRVLNIAGPNFDPTQPATAAGFRADMAAQFNKGAAFDINVDDIQWISVDLTTTFGAGGLTGTWTVAALAARMQVVLNQALVVVNPALKVKVEEKNSGNFSALRITSDTAEHKSVRIRRSGQKDLAGDLMLGSEQGGMEPTRFSEFRPVPTGSFLYLPDILPLATTVTRDEIQSIKIDQLPAVTFDFTTATNKPTDPWFLDGTGGGRGIREKLEIIAKKINDAGIPWRAEVWGYQMAILPKAGAAQTMPATIASAGKADLGSGLKPNVRRYSIGPSGGIGNYQIAGSLGTAGSAPTLSEYEGSINDQTGFHALDPVDLFNIMVLPGDREVSADDMASVWGPASTYCAEHRAFLLIDPPDSWTGNGGTPRPAITQNQTLLNDLRGPVVKENAAVFYPKLVFQEGTLKKTIGPAGLIAGVMARTDSTRGVWKAPAGLDAGLRNIIGLEVKLTDRENGILNKEGVNALRQFPSGFVSWGARTLSGDDYLTSEWKYIPIRRFALFLEESLFRGTKWVVFEPNDEPLWANIRKNLRAFMMSLFKQQAFQGSTPDQAFYVKCDGETTSANDRNLGVVNIEVGFSPLKPAEFVVIKIQQIADIPAA